MTWFGQPFHRYGATERRSVFLHPYCLLTNKRLSTANTSMENGTRSSSTIIFVGYIVCIPRRWVIAGLMIKQHILFSVIGREQREQRPTSVQ